MAEYIVSTSHIGNGQQLPPPRSVKAFRRGLPRRLAVLEDNVEDQARRIDELQRQIVEARQVAVADPLDPVFRARLVFAERIVARALRRPRPSRARVQAAE